MPKETIRVHNIMHDAEHAFWAEVVKHLPLADSGDFAPDETDRWQTATEAAITTWWFWNASEHYDLQGTNGEILKAFHECDCDDGKEVVSMDYISVCCGAERNEYADYPDLCGTCRKTTSFECLDCGKAETTKNIVYLESGGWR